MEDMIEVLMYVSRFKPQVLEGIPMEELLLFFVTFMGSPAYIKNPYLRSRMVEVGIATDLANYTTRYSLLWNPLSGMTWIAEGVSLLHATECSLSDSCMMRCASKLCATNEKACYQRVIRAGVSYLSYIYLCGLNNLIPRRFANPLFRALSSCDGAFWCAGAVAMDAHG